VTDIHEIYTYMLTAVERRQQMSKTGSVTIIHIWANSYLVTYSSLHKSHHPHMDTRLRQCVTFVSKILASRKSKTFSL